VSVCVNDANISGSRRKRQNQLCARSVRPLIGIKKNNMIQKLLIVVALGVALYVHNLPMFFGMVAAFLVGLQTGLEKAQEMVQITRDFMKDVKKIINEHEAKQTKNHDE
jgi:hypothetical protein